MGNLFKFLFLGTIVSFFLFPISFMGLPVGLNTKVMLAGFGGIMIVYRFFELWKVRMTYGLLASTLIALVFSFICFISTDINHTDDYSYATYIGSFAIWLLSAYAVTEFIRFFYGEVSFKILTFYIAGVCFTQCVLAMVIDHVPAFRSLVDAVVFQGQDFLKRVDRLYGIGASLDPAGVRFSICLVLIAGLLSGNEEVRKSNKNITLLLIAYFTIVVIGNSISRTTIIGFGGSLVLFFLSSGLFSFIIKLDSIKLGVLSFVIIAIGVVATVYFYQTSDSFYEQMRFAFEGFFSWVETGEWRTDSTDKLNNEMWIWPTDTKTWLIGSGVFGNYVYSTDIGYCRFILYCGLIGFSVFAILFVFNALYFMSKHKGYRLMFFVFLAITFVIWLKVATDIFFIYALFYCVDYFTAEEEVKDTELIEKNEDNLLYPRYV